MTLNEINLYLDTEITSEQLEAIEPAYYIMDLPTKEQFAKVINVVGIEVLINQQEYYKTLLEDRKMGMKRRDYESQLRTKEKLILEQKEIQEKIRILHKSISAYEEEQARQITNGVH